MTTTSEHSESGRPVDLAPLTEGLGALVARLLDEARQCDKDGMPDMERLLNDAVRAINVLCEEHQRWRAALGDYFAAADASWVEVCRDAQAQGIRSVPIGEHQAAALNKFNALRDLLQPKGAPNTPILRHPPPDNTNHVR
jgi:hypothetical protein